MDTEDNNNNNNSSTSNAADGAVDETGKKDPPPPPAAAAAAAAAVAEEDEEEDDDDGDKKMAAVDDTSSPSKKKKKGNKRGGGAASKKDLPTQMQKKKRPRRGKKARDKKDDEDEEETAALTTATADEQDNKKMPGKVNTSKNSSGALNDKDIKQMEKKQKKVADDKAEWTARYAEMVAFKEQHGHCIIPKTTELGKYCEKLRLAKRDSTLVFQRQCLLEDLDFPWTLFDESFELSMQKLEPYYQEHGHCNVPKGHEMHPWLARQRHLYQTKQLQKQQPTRVQRLEARGVKWQIYEARQSFATRIEQLKEFKEKMQHCNVPQQGSSLGEWVRSQRKKHASGKLKPEETTALEEVGIQWSVKQSPQPWEARYQQLVEFKTKHGHPNVPKSSGTLGLWGHDQRRKRRAGKLAQDRIDKLDQLGFVWEPKKATHHTEKYYEAAIGGGGSTAASVAAVASAAGEANPGSSGGGGGGSPRRRYNLAQAVKSMLANPADLETQLRGADLMLQMSRENNQQCGRIIHDENAVKSLVLAMENHTSNAALVQNACCVFENLLVSGIDDARTKSKLDDADGVARLGIIFKTYKNNPVVRDRISAVITLAVQP